ncbi:MAG: IS110 family transposase [Gracilimonas sp.]|uniref:IS110 family transposase n=1 Tax=Gracilimonas sp. TaxID=1974203 RepID=UPI0037503CD1|nr:IS110 family transposase [Gracilimonas sp.]
MDWQVNDVQNRQLAIGKIGNEPEEIRQLLDSWSQQGMSLEKMMVCFEHTGPYGLLLAAMLKEAGVRYVMVAAAQVHRSLGIRRGKSDPIDAARLAEYGWRFRDRLSASHLPSKALLELRGWLL